MRTTSTRWRLAATIGAAALATALLSPAAGLAAESCSTSVVHTPTGSQGDTRAVAITSQVLEADAKGWARVGWQAADGVTVTAVTVVDEDGSEHPGQGNLQSGMAENALELRFCGTTGPPENASDQGATAPSAASTDDGSKPGESAAKGAAKGSDKAAENAPEADETGPGDRAADRDERKGPPEQAGNQGAPTTTGRDAAPDTSPADDQRADAGKRAQSDGTAGTDGTDPADAGIETAEAATPEAPPAEAGGAGEPASGGTGADVTVTTTPTSLPVADEAHRVEQVAIGTDIATTSGVEQARLAAREHGPATLLTWGLLGLIAGAAVTTGAHRLHGGVQR